MYSFGGKLNTPKVSIVMLNYNGLSRRTIFENSLKSVFATSFSNFEFIFVDNSSTDESLGFFKAIYGSFPKVKIIPLQSNMGFTKGNNIGAKHLCSDSEFIVFLNNDTIVTQDWLTLIINEFINNIDIGIVQPSLAPLKYEGKVAKPILNSNELSFASGACLAIRRALFNAVGGWGEVYFFYCDDIDLSFKILASGYKISKSNGIVFHETGSNKNPLLVYHDIRSTATLLSKWANSDVQTLGLTSLYLAMKYILRFYYHAFKKDRMKSYCLLKGWTFVLRNANILVDIRRENYWERHRLPHSSIRNFLKAGLLSPLQKPG